MKALRNFDIVTQLIALAGRIHARRVQRLKDREAALAATIKFASEALTATQRQRQETEKRKIGE